MPFKNILFNAWFYNNAAPKRPILKQVELKSKQKFKCFVFFQAGWKGVNLQMFMSELKNLDGLNLSDVGRGLKETFDLLNVNRLHTGVDNYGLVRS